MNNERKFFIRWSDQSAKCVFVRLTVNIECFITYYSGSDFIYKCKTDKNMYLATDSLTLMMWKVIFNNGLNNEFHAVVPLSVDVSSHNKYAKKF